MLHPAFLEQNRTVTCVLAKRTKSPKQFYNFQQNDPTVLKVEGKKFKLGTEICLSRVLLRARSAPRLSSYHLTAVPTLNIAELVPSFFSMHNHGFCDGTNTFFQGKHSCLSHQLLA